MPQGFLTENVTDFGPVTTVDNTPTYLMSHDFQPDSNFHIVVRVICRNPANGDMKTWFRSLSAKRVGTNNVQQVGSLFDIQTQGDASLAAATISLGVSGGNGRVNVTGIAGTTLEWYGQFSALGIVPDPS